MNSPTELSTVTRLLRSDVKQAAEDAIVSPTLARYLVDYYYISQDDRKRAHNQQRAMGEAEEPAAVVAWLAGQAGVLEDQIKRVLDAYTSQHVMGSWMREIHGIGPVISAGLLAHIDIEKAPTVGHIWRFAGLDSSVKWSKGQKRPWNAGLKTLCWKVGQSFMKFHNAPECYYGHIYRARKDYEIARNERGDNRALALELSAGVGKTTEAFKHLTDGHLPPGQIDARARRYAVKQFLADMHGEWYRRHFGAEPPLPYPIAILGHAHLRQPPDRQSEE